MTPKHLGIAYGIPRVVWVGSRRTERCRKWDFQTPGQTPGLARCLARCLNRYKAKNQDILRQNDAKMTNEVDRDSKTPWNRMWYPSGSLGRLEAYRAVSKLEFPDTWPNTWPGQVFGQVFEHVRKAKNE